MSLTLTIQNFRALRRVKWSMPTGVLGLVGPNGSGKSTLLNALLFLQQAYMRDLLRAANSYGGGFALKSFSAPVDEPVSLGVEVGALRWELELGFSGSSLDRRSAERVTLDGRQILLRDLFANTVLINGNVLPCDDRIALRLAHDMQVQDRTLDPLVGIIRDYRLFREYVIRDLRYRGSNAISDPQLSFDGGNVFSVLRQWRDVREMRQNYEFVLQGLRDAFPDVFADLDFDVAGQTISARLLAPAGDSVPAFFAPNGLIAALVHLCAVASTPRGGIVAIDEFENSLHPFAIRRLIESLRDWANARDITVILTTHSPVVIDQFREEPSALFILQPGEALLPVPVSEFRDPAWLSQFSLGDLFTHGEFGAPRA